MASVVALRLHLSRGAERVRDTLGRALVVGGEAHPHVAVVEDRVVLAIGLLDLVQRLRDEKAFQAIAGHERQRALEEVEPTQCWKLVEHEQQALPLALGLQIFGQSTANLVQQQADERLGARDVRRRDDEVKRDGSATFNEVADAPVALPRHPGHNRVAIQAEERHGRGQHPRSLVVRLVQQLACRAGDHRVHAVGPKVGGCHHRAQRRLDRPSRVGQEVGDAGERLVGFGIEDVQDRADKERVAGLLPVVASFQRAFGIDQDVGDILNVTDLAVAPAHL